MTKYEFDVIRTRTRRFLKQKFPSPLSTFISKLRNRDQENPIIGMVLNNVPPWSSPNIWHEITSFYENINQPHIFEYGTGNSSLWHFENLLKKGGGLYIGVEYDQDWFWAVIGAISIRAVRFSENISIIKTGFELPNNVDIVITSGNVKAVIKLRPLDDSYINSLDNLFDVIIIDGASRKLCVNHILSSKHLKPGGLMMLMEAGRGSPEWWEGKLNGDVDYTDEVKKMIDLGGKLLDGDGIDSWPGCVRKSPPPVSYKYPMEACKLILSKV